METHIAYDPDHSLVYGIGRSPEEAIDDAAFSASVVRGPLPWGRLETRPCTMDEALTVAANNGPATLAQLRAVAP